MEIVIKSMTILIENSIKNQDTDENLKECGRDI